MQKLCIGDEVLVITGRAKGQRGKILIFKDDRQKVVIEGLNLATKHQKPRQAGQKGQKIQMPQPIHISNVMLIDPKTAQTTRAKIVQTPQGRVRQGRKSHQDIPTVIRKKVKAN